MTRFPAQVVRLLGTLPALMAIRARGAAACSICLSVVSASTGQKLDAADQAVLAVPLLDGERFRVVEVVRSNAATSRFLTGEIQRLDAVALHSLSDARR